MPTIKIDINKITDEQVDLIVDCLKNGQVIAYPTDTVYGLGCDARDAVAVSRIKNIKGPAFAKATAGEGQRKKPFIVLVSDFKMLEKYCAVSEEQMEYLKKVWSDIIPPAPFIKGANARSTTVILENKRNLPDELTRPLARQAGGLDSLAVRLPNSDFLVKIISKCGFPIVSTSLNKTGEPTLDNVQNLEKYFDNLPDLVIDAGRCENTKPSRLVDIRDMENVKVIRE